mgnify:CR=1 FL=1
MTFEVIHTLIYTADLAEYEVEQPYGQQTFHNGDQVDGKSLLSILTLACPRGSRMTITAEGNDANEAIEALGKVIEDKFGED